METNLTKEELTKLLAKMKPDPRVMNEETVHYHKFMRIADCDRPRDLCIYPIEEKRLEKLNRVFINILSSLNKLAREAVFHDSWLSELGLPELDIEAVKSRNLEHLFDYARIDSIFDGYSYKVLEVNAKRPQIYEEVDWMTNFMKKATEGKIEGTSITDQIVRSIKKANSINTKAEPELVIIISDFVKYLERERIKSALTESVKRIFNKSKVIILGCKGTGELGDKIKYKSWNVIYDGLKLGQVIIKDVCPKELSIFNNNGGIDNEYLSKGYRHKSFDISSPPTAKIIGSKIALSMILRPEIQDKIRLNQDEIESLKLVLDNYLVKSNRINFNKNNYVIKMAERGGGKGVFLGSQLTTKMFKDLLEKLIDENKKVLLQEKAKFGLEEVIDLNSYSLSCAYTTLDPFIINNDKISVAGYASRAIKENKVETEPRFNPDANREEIMFSGVVATL